MLRVVLSAFLVVLFILSVWVVIGPHHPAFPWVFSAGLFGILGLTGQWPDSLVPRWATATTQRTLHRARLFRVPTALRALDRVGWNGALGRRGSRVHGRAGVVVIRANATQSLIAHGVGALIHLLVAMSAALVGAWWSALIVLSLGVLLHLMPVAMQRYILARIDRVDHLTQALRGARSVDS